MAPAKTKSQPQIAALVNRNLSSLKLLGDSLDQTKKSFSIAGSHLARFKLWSGTLGAHRTSGTRGLEYRLRDASLIKNQVLSLLNDLSNSIDQAQASTQESIEPQRSFSDIEIEKYFQDGDAATQGPLDRSLSEIGHIVDCLLRLSATIKNPAPHDQFEWRTDLSTINYEQWDVRHVQEKFKNIDSTIAERLGRALTVRRQYFKYREEHHDKLSRDLDADDEDISTVASSIPKNMKDTSVMTSLLDPTDNQSSFSTTSYVPSTADSDQLRVPPLPKDHLNGPFLCPFCRTIVEIDTRSEWKKHVFRDLRPYVCIEKTCETSKVQYARRNEWIHHMKHEHWKIWSCYFGCPGNFPTWESFRVHIQTSHGSIMPMDELSALKATGPHCTFNVPSTCPLCRDVHIKDSRQYSSHVGHHLELVALFALPDLGDNDDTEADEADELEENGSEGEGVNQVEDRLESEIEDMLGGLNLGKSVPPETHRPQSQKNDAQSGSRIDAAVALGKIRQDDEEALVQPGPEAINSPARSSSPERMIRLTGGGGGGGGRWGGGRVGGGKSDLRWICPKCPGSNNSWRYDSSCPLCFHTRPYAPQTFYA